MRRAVTTIVLGSLLLLSANLSAPAEESADGGAPAQAEATAKLAQKTEGSDAAASKSKDGDGGLKGAVKGFPVAAASFTAGAVVGTPVAIVRKFYLETLSGVRDIIGESTNPVLFAPCVIVSAPYAAVSAGLQGPFFGIKNSLFNAYDEPFSKESFSLGEMK